MRIAVIGTGYVGLTTAVSLAMKGHTVTGIDIDEAKINKLTKGEVPFFEPGVDRSLAEVQRAGMIRFTTRLTEGVSDADVIFICVGTPGEACGQADLTHLFAVVDELRTALPQGDCDRMIVVKSTVPVGTTDKVAGMFADRKEWMVVTNPEFLREGTALQDSLAPTRIILGAAEPTAFERMEELYRGFHAPVVRTTRTNAEMIKYASNAFLATRISFMNELARLCDHIGTDVSTIALGMGLDPRIGPEFLRAGLGYGGSCFPKDTRALLEVAREHGQPMSILEHAIEVNATQPQWFLGKMEQTLGTLHGKRIAILGLSFKPDTDDIRESPAHTLISSLLARGAEICAHDPVAIANMRKVYPQITYAADAYAAAEEADVIILVTEWKEYVRLDWSRVLRVMRGPYLFDGRNALPERELTAMGFHYIGIGVEPGSV
ncbi:UDP-glucose dehydrogenase family protein [Brevibacillus dissolubilis]|uniref:UDP-glucose dehydrogenase family protein n=1 Tax=Brevibacillus dissolubilis TaxID=1844116 RepID=UPI0011174C61|nr:UDP-glucose/GDP-mannose dehydrogenase family protein [Brevibacillus dissolubilis]